MAPYHFLVATYTDSIYTLHFDPSADPPSISLKATLKIGHHPSWITAHPSEPSLIYTCSETTDGRVFALRVDAEGTAKIIAEASSEGADPCTLVASESELFIGNYSTGTVAALPINKQEPYFVPSTRKTRHQLSGTGPQADRQEASHPHQVLLLHSATREREELLVPDLGADKTWRFVRNAEDIWAPEAAVAYTPGGGPRHVALHENVLYTVLELTSSISAHTLPPLPSSTAPLVHAAAPRLLASAPTQSDPHALDAADPLPRLAAEILVTPASAGFPEPLIYVSNRNDPHPEGDIIAVFRPLPASAAEEGAGEQTLELVAEIRSGLNHLRGMIFFGPEDKYLIAGGALGGGVKVFERVKEGKGLREVAGIGLEIIDMKPTGFLCLQ